MHKKTHLQKLKREMRLVDRDISRRKVTPRVDAFIRSTANAIYSARPVGMKTWNEFDGERSGRVAVVCHINEPVPFARILYLREFPNAKLEVYIVDESELKGIPIDVHPESHSVLMPRVVFYSMGQAISIDANPTEAQMIGIRLD
jgi:hypothetical protein